MRKYSISHIEPQEQSGPHVLSELMTIKTSLLSSRPSSSNTGSHSNNIANHSSIVPVTHARSCILESALLKYGSKWGMGQLVLICICARLEQGKLVSSNPHPSIKSNWHGFIALIQTNIPIDPSRMKHLLEYHSECPFSKRYQRRVGLPRWERSITSFKTSYVKLDGLALLREVVIERREGWPE